MNIEQAIKQRKFDDEKEKLAVNLTFTSNWLNGHVKDLLKNYNLTPQQYNVLRILKGQYPKPCSVLTIKERMLDKESNVSRLIDKLVQSNLIVRKQCPDDRRQLDVTIRKPGIDLLEKINKEMKELFKQIIQLDNQDAQSLNSALDSMRK